MVRVDPRNYPCFHEWEHLAYLFSRRDQPIYQDMAAGRDPVQALRVTEA